jgi:prolyl-tRNA editing enzyme YbaK/EbsC (Cys-tRNA(Pro) deacylase)
MYAPPSPRPPVGVAAVEPWLDEHLPDYAVITHDPSFAARDEARFAHHPAEQMAKTVVVHDRARLVAAVLPASDRLDLGKVRRLLGAGRAARLATEGEIGDAFPAFEVGAVPPVAGFNLVLLDQRLLTYTRILIPGGDHRHAVAVDPEELVRSTRARVVDLRAGDR